MQKPLFQAGVEVEVTENLKVGNEYIPAGRRGYVGTVSEAERPAHISWDTTFVTLHAPGGYMWAGWIPNQSLDFANMLDRLTRV